MKITIELEELDLKGKGIFDEAAYPNEGIYLVNDNIAYNIVSKVNGSVYTVPIANKDILKQYIDADTAVACININRDIDNKFDTILDAIKHQPSTMVQTLSNILSNTETIINSKHESNDSNVNIKDLTHLVAVAQKPELIKDK